MKKIFISHSSKDKKYVAKIIDLLEYMKIPSKRIFCSSFEGDETQLSKDLVLRIKNEFDNDVIVLFVLSNNYYQSMSNICELGAILVKVNNYIPMVIPPLDNNYTMELFSKDQILKINEIENIDSLYDTIRFLLNIIEQVDNLKWERKRNDFLFEIDKFIELELKDRYKSNNTFIVSKSLNVENDRITLTELLEKGILDKTDILFALYKNNKYEATLIEENENVKIKLGDMVFKTPSSAATRVTSTSQNGWLFWSVRNKNNEVKGRLLDLRNKI